MRSFVTTVAILLLFINMSMSQTNRDIYENNNFRKSASNINVGEIQEHTIYPGNDKDWLLFISPQKAKYNIHLSNQTLDLSLKIWNGSSRFFSPQTAVVKEFVIRPEKKNEFYFILIESQHQNSTGNYQIEITENIPKYSGGSYIDPRDEHVYKIIYFGTQVWFAENLAYLPSISPPSSTYTEDKHFYVYNYEGNNLSEAKSTSNYATYGVLYNWSAALVSCPPGWHLPSMDEWSLLEMELGMTQSAFFGIGWRGTNEGMQMKAISGWYNDGNGNNSIGFSALPGGSCSFDGKFEFIDYNGFWWSSSESSTTHAWNLSLRFSLDKINCFSMHKKSGLSVRCVRDK